MKIKVEYYKDSGKWYTTQEWIVGHTDYIENDLKKLTTYSGMTAVVYIVESDGYLQPYRMFKL